MNQEPIAPAVDASSSVAAGDDKFALGSAADSKAPAGLSSSLAASQTAPIQLSPAQAPPIRIRLIRAPLLAVALAMLAGVVAGRYLDWPVGLWGAAAGIGLVGAAVTFRRSHLHVVTSTCIVLAIAGLAAVHTNIAYFRLADNDLVTFTDDRPILATIRGQIVTSPVVVDDTVGFKGGYLRPPKTSFLVEARAVQTADGWRDISGLVRVTVAEETHKLQAGRVVELVGSVGRVRMPDNPGQTDWAAKARIEHTMVWMSVPVADGAALLDDEPSWPRRAYWHVRSGLRQHLANCGDVEDGRLVNALISGERHPALTSLNRMMMQAGVVHFLSISGQHLMIFLGFMYMLCRLMSLSPRWSAVVVLVVLAAYMALAEPNAPLFRSAIMAAAVAVAMITGRHHNPLNGICGAFVILLLFDPLQLFNAGFQLSFALVAGMIVLHQPLRELLFGRWLRHRGLMVFRREHRVRRWLHYSAANWGIAAVVMTLSAYFVSLPLVAYHFSLVSPYAGVLSLLLEPLVALVLIPGYLSVALAWPMPHLSAWLGQLAGGVADFMQRVVSQMQKIPGLCFDIQPAPVWWVLLCYGMLAFAVLGRPRLPRGNWVTAALLAALVGATVAVQLPAGPPRALEANFLSVGAGQCCVLRAADGRTYIIDAGTLSGHDVFAQDLQPFIRNQRLPAPTATFISHANNDHYNAVPSLAAWRGMERLYVNDYFAVPGACKESSTRPAAFDEGEPIPRELAPVGPTMLLKEVQRTGAEVVRIHGGQKLQLDEQTTLEVLWPPQESPKNMLVNDTSLVLKITCDGRSIIIPGDIDELGQKALIALGPAVRADVLVMPHHGNWRTTLPALLEAVRPRIVIASAPIDPRAPVSGKGAASGQRFYAGLRQDYQYFTTARNGWIQVRLGQGKVELKTMR